MAGILLGRTRDQAEPHAQTEPHRWALALWARAFRRAARPVVIDRHVRRFCSPLDLAGLEHFGELRPPAIVIANHTSHWDTLLVLSVLPAFLYGRVAVAAAADRFYRERLKGAWFSLRYNAYPIARGGGKAALDYSEQLLRSGWSVLIFPEGTRSRTGDLLPFHPGPAILALRQHVPVLPIHIQGAADLLPPGTRWSRPAAVRVAVGSPLCFDGAEGVGDATARMEDAMRSLARPGASEPAAVPA